jgi:hypothetical protein
MSTWLQKYKISNALNDRLPLPPAVERAVSRSAELRSFAEHASALGHALKSETSPPEAPAFLHASIMRAVRHARSTTVRETPSAGLRWVPAFGLVCLILLGGLLATQFSSPPAVKVSPVDSPSLAAVDSALEFGGTLIREAPDVALSPLSDELQRLNRNLADTGQFLLASLP